MRVEDNPIQIIHWEVGKVWKNKHWNNIYSKQLFHWQHFHLGALLTASCIFFFSFEREVLLTPLRNGCVLKILNTKGLKS